MEKDYISKEEKIWKQRESLGLTKNIRASIKSISKFLEY
jgi:hypothetical protein